MKLFTRLVVLVFLCCLGFFLGHQTASADLSLTNSECELATCIALADETNSTCGEDNKCRFSNYGTGSMFYCYTYRNATCKIPTPVVTNQCTGRCVNDEEVECTKTASKCKLI